jgi:hypothetical protein
MNTIGGVLLSDGPDPRGATELMQFGRFVGAWDLDVTYFDPAGVVSREVKGEWHFGWVLEGRAVADVWIVPRRSLRGSSGPPAGEYGMSLRFYDNDIAAWRSTWLGPVHKVVLPFIAKQVGETMVLERTEGERMVRWIFSEITPETFKWQNIVSIDDGATWHLEQQFKARRAE